jgi:hypothetical protein
VNFCTDMVSDQSNDAFAIRRGHRFASVHQATRQPVGPEPAIPVEHHFNDCRIVQKTGHCRTESRAQHARAA